jgi:hypothetical protein
MVRVKVAGPQEGSMLRSLLTLGALVLFLGLLAGFEVSGPERASLVGSFLPFVPLG